MPLAVLALLLSNVWAWASDPTICNPVPLCIEMLAMTTVPEPQVDGGGMTLDYLEFNAMEKGEEKERGKKPVNRAGLPEKQQEAGPEC